MNISELAREAYIQVANELCDGKEWWWAGVGEPLQRFAALIREAVVQELVAGSGEPVGYNYIGHFGFRPGLHPNEKALYTADQLAGAVLRERERCAVICETRWRFGIGGPHQGDVFAAAIRGQT